MICLTYTELLAHAALFAVILLALVVFKSLID